jgi:uncharacterized membrane protein required for colicin V production
MTIWVLALLLVASLAALGYRQGAIRVSFSLLGIIVGALLALPLSNPVSILLKAFGVAHPILLWLLPPVVAFCLINAAFKGIALAVHQKVDVHFKYKAGDLRYALWERLSGRVGLCLGVVNGVAYTALIAFVIYVLGYWTVQMDSGEGMARSVRILNQATRDLASSGFSKTARALEQMPESYYDAADITGKLYQNSLLEARLARYPAFLMLGEKPEFQALNTSEFTSMRARQDSISQLMDYGPVRSIWENPDTLRMIWGIVQPDLKDLATFLDTGESPKYSQEPILGRWNFNLRGTLALLRQSNPNITSTQMARLRGTMQAFFGKTRLIVGTDGQIAVKDWPNLKKPPAKPAAPARGAAPTPPPAPPAPELVSSQGKWSGANGNYHLEFSAGGPMTPSVTVEGDRMAVVADKAVAAFEREY